MGVALPWGWKHHPTMGSFVDKAPSQPPPVLGPPYHAHTGPFFLVLILGPLESPLPSSLVGLDQGPGFPTYPIPRKSGCVCPRCGASHF